MDNVTLKRHVLPCRHNGAEKKIYVVWTGDGDGKTELDMVMRQFGETEYKSEASPTEHFRNITLFLRQHGFDEIKR